VIEAALPTLIAMHGGVVSLVGNRIYPERVPQDVARPAIAYRRISTPRVHSLGGASKLARPRFELTVVAESKDNLVQVREALRVGLDGFVGWVSDTHIQAMWLEDEDSDFGERTGLYESRLDFLIWHREV